MSEQAIWAEQGTRDAAIGTGRAFGSFGELLQGVLPGNDRDFLVTLPIDAWSTATFHYLPEAGQIHVFPQWKRKSQLLARFVMEAAGYPGGGVLALTSRLPVGKGLASSSADLVATARAVAAALDVPMGAPVIESLLRRIEPSDGVMYDGIVAFYHREVRLHSRLGTLPPLTIIGHDEGGQVDTISHNRRTKTFDAAEKREYGRLLSALAEAVRNGDLRGVGQVSTRSTVMNSKVRTRRDLDHLKRVCAEVDGLGLVLAHSGTMLGILIAGDDPDRYAKTEHVAVSCAPLGGEVAIFRSLSGPRPPGCEGDNGH
jgi:uncharacterized protein involved in propanediol utilization